MSRSHIAQLHSTPSTPTTPSNPFTSSHPRDSGVNAIGNLLSAPYDTDDELDSDAETLSSPAVRMRQPVARAGPAVHAAQGWGVDAKVRSYEGEVAGGPQYAYGADAGQGRQSQESGVLRPPTVVEFPEPTLQPNQGHGYGGGGGGIQPTNGLGLSHGSPPRAPVRSNSGPGYQQGGGYEGNGGYGGQQRPSPQRSVTAPLQPARYPPQNPHQHSPQQSPYGQQRPHPTITTALQPPPSILLPPPSSPISPLLAAPPAPHFSPLASPSSPAGSPSPRGSPGSPFRGPTQPAHSRASSASESIRGFDAMAEKKAFFREGQDELMVPFSPRRREPKPSGLRQGTRASGMDFWKRFSVSVRLDEVEKQKGPSSDWLSKAQGERGNIRKIIFAVLLLIILMVAGIVAGVLIHKANSGSDDSASTKVTGNL
ncbi:hypothetical protein IAT38_006278 [Cryptococcus sp. DSM 104549]